MSRYSDLRTSLEREFLDIENHPDLSADEKVQRVIRVCSAGAAAIAIQPVPMADFALQLPVLGYMGYKIGRIRGVDIREHQADRLTGEIIATVGMTFATRQVLVGLYKTAFPFVGALTTFPLMFGLVYAVGKVMDYYFRAQAAGENVTRETLSEVFHQAREEGEAEGKKEQSERTPRSRVKADKRKTAAGKTEKKKTDEKMVDKKPEKKRTEKKKTEKKKTEKKKTRAKKRG